MHLNTNLTPFRFLLGNPIPFFPFPLSRGRGISYIREASPPFDPPFKGGEEISERGFAPLLSTPPFPLTNNKGRGLGG